MIASSRDCGAWLFAVGLVAAVMAAPETAGTEQPLQVAPNASPGETNVSVYYDQCTGAEIRNLTPDMPRAQVIYQTHPMWTADMAFLVFHGEHEGTMAPHAREMATGEIRCVVDGAAGASVLDSKRSLLYYMVDDGLRVVGIEEAFRGEAEPRQAGSLPDNARGVSGGLSLDAKGDRLYAGVVIEEEATWALLALDIATGQWETVTELDFQVGHVQANPVTSRVIMFCQETGGDAPQRTWVVNADGSGPRPFYKETYGEWVTHEVWWGGDRAVFTVWPYDEAHKRQPHGVVSADLATGAPTVHAQFPAWHTHGSPDGQWLVADDFDRNLWLIKIESGERRLLTQGRLGKGFKTHPHPSFTPDSKALVFNSSKHGKEGVFLVRIPDWQSLPLP